MNLPNKNILIKILLKKSDGEKRKFIFAGLINVLITNFILQILLLSDSNSIAFATFLSQFFNMLFGYLIYSKFIFKIRNIGKTIFIFKYFIMMISIWILNSFLINIGFNIGFSRNFAALFCIPLLALTSYILQKLWVFK